MTELVNAIYLFIASKKYIIFIHTQPFQIIFNHIPPLSSLPILILTYILVITTPLFPAIINPFNYSFHILNYRMVAGLLLEQS